MTYCPCNTFDEVSAGGLSAGGGAVVTSDTREGGALAGGSAIVSVVGEMRAYDGLLAVYPLDEEQSPYLDRTIHMQDGTAATATSPTQDDGVFCLSSNYFDGRDFIDLSIDRFPADHEMAFSCWVRIQTMYSEKTFFSDRFFAIGTSYLNHLKASIRLNNGDTETTVLAFSTTRLSKDRWHHIAASWTPSGSLKLWIDGEYQGETETPYSETGALTTRSQIGRFSGGQSVIGNLQEVRLFPEAKSSAYWTAEHDNFCKAGFVLQGETVGATG
ncbi:MAG: LamG-like jellyroll fold domain-containing protein [Planctomycetaceae bacterium]